MTQREEEIHKASQLTSLTYMIGGCLNYSIENLFKYLDFKNVVLEGKEKMVLNRIKQQLTQLKSNLYTLEDLAFKVMGSDEEAKLAYEDATHIYWAAFLLLVDRGGTDELCDLRLKALIDILSKYKSLLDLPGMKTAYSMAFGQVSKAISEGKYKTSDFKNLLQICDEDRLKDPESKI